MPRPEDLSNQQMLLEIVRNESLDAKTRKRAQKLLDFSVERNLKEVEDSVKRSILAQKQRALASEEAHKQRMDQQSSCTHMKQNPVTGSSHSHCRGQQMSDGRIVIICQACAAIFSDPPNPKEGWLPLEDHRHLYPTDGGLGSVMDPGAMVDARRKLAAEQREEVAERDQLEAQTEAEIEASVTV